MVRNSGSLHELKSWNWRQKREQSPIYRRKAPGLEEVERKWAATFKTGVRMAEGGGRTRGWH